MACFRPLHAFRSEHVKTKKGKAQIVFKECLRSRCDCVLLPCGQCIGCKLSRSREWAIRCVHEAQCHEHNSFVTLTYKDPPKGGSLDHSDFQKFMKRLRKRMPARYYMCGEYGETLGRPHFHACLFGVDFADKVYWTKRNGIPLFVSPLLTKIWGLGHATVGSVTFDSAAYVARYITKKITGPKAEGHYEGRQPEYNRMSLKPAIGREWFETYGDEIFPQDRVILPGRSAARPPRYYSTLYERYYPEDFDKIRAARIERAIDMHDENVVERLIAREEVALARLNKLVRTLK